MSDKVRRRRTPKVLVDPSRFSGAVKRVKEYIDKDRNEELKKIINGKISWSTVLDYVRLGDKAVTAYKAITFVEIAESLPPLGNDRFLAYKFILNELGSNGSQISYLSKFEGLYEITHNFRIGYKKSIRSFLINCDKKLDTCNFVFGYRPDFGSKTRKCDGFVFSRNQRLYFIALSESSIFYAVVRAVLDPKKEIMYGFAAFEDIYQQKVIFSNITLREKYIEESLKDENNIQKHIYGNFKEL